MSKKTKTIIIIALPALAVLIAALTILAVMHFRQIEFISQPPFRYVSEDNKTLTMNICEEYGEVIKKVRVAEDSRSLWCIRFAFTTRGELDDDQIEGILDMIFTKMKTHNHSILVRFPLSWEVFFCEGGRVYKGYVSLYGTDPSDSARGIITSFQDWQEIPDVEKLLSINTLNQMLKRTDISLYLPSEKPIAEQNPAFPIRKR